MEKNLKKKNAALCAVSDFYAKYLYGNNTVIGEEMKDAMFNIMWMVTEI